MSKQTGRVLDGEAWLTREQLARDTALSLAEVDDAICELVEHGYLLVDGDGPLQRFRMVMPAEALKRLN